MNAFDLQIDRLRLEVSNAAGQEHRLAPIAARAAALLAADLDRGTRRPGAPQRTVNLQTMSDEQAARIIADGWLSAVELKLVG